MRRIKTTFQVISALIVVWIPVFGTSVPAGAVAANAPSLVISQLKITSSNGQFVTLYNTTNSELDMSKYQLEYFNNYDLTKATSSRLIALSGNLPPHSYYMVNDSSLLLCYQLTVDSLSLGFSSTAGLIEVFSVNQAQPGGSVAPLLQDHVGWSKTAATGAVTLPTSINAFLSRTPVDANRNPAVTTPGSGTWQNVQPDPANPCQLITATGVATTVLSGMSQLLPPTLPPIVLGGYEESADQSTQMSGLPSSDIGLMSPLINELLPNPLGTGNDSTEEFIELYNPNNSPFDLTGFSLESGLSVMHTFAFPAGTKLPARSFTALHSTDTGLSLSNTSGQVKLLDPYGNSLFTTDIYTSARDGQAWAFANGTWKWTTSPSPGAANIINAPTKKSSKKTSRTSSKSSTKRYSASKKHQAQRLKTVSTSALQPQTSPTPAHIHLWLLAIVGSIAILYAGYEYRTDLANRIQQLRRDRRNS